MEPQNILYINHEESSMEIMKLTGNEVFHYSLMKDAGNWSKTFQPKAMLTNPDEGDTCDRNCDSPLKEAIRITVPAVVHHPLDWSPSADKVSESFWKKQNQKESDKEPDDSGFDGDEMDLFSSSNDACISEESSSDVK